MIAFNQAFLVLFLRVGIVALLFLFLAAVVVAARGDLTRGISRSRAAGRAQGGTARLTDNASLVVVNQGPTHLAPGHRFVLRNPTIIGRGTSNDVSLDDEFVSNHHARLLFLNGSWHLEDLGSTNGTWLRGTQVNGSSPLTVGDVMTIGRVDLRLEG